jgi:hypothetical protein
MAIDILSLDDKINQDEIDKEFAEHALEADEELQESLDLDLLNFDDDDEDDEYEESYYDDDDFDGEKKRKRKKSEDDINAQRTMSYYLTQIRKIGEYNQEELNEKAREYRRLLAEGKKKEATTEEVAADEEK